MMRILRLQFTHGRVPVNLLVRVCIRIEAYPHAACGYKSDAPMQRFGRFIYAV